MCIINLKISKDTHKKWLYFLKTKQAGKLMEADLLGDWVCLGFMSEVSRYLKEGIPASRASSKKEELELNAVEARRKLSREQKRILPMFDQKDEVTKKEISLILNLSLSQTNRILLRWQKDEFLMKNSVSNTEETYILTKKWRKHNLMANRPSLNAPRQPMMSGKLKD